MKTIFVDDSPIIIDVIREQVGHIDVIGSAKFFTSPLDALDYVRGNKVDVAFLDVQMPDMDGVELASHIQEVQPACDIIYITSDPTAKSKALEQDCRGYLMKPVATAEIEMLLEHIYRRKCMDQRFRVRVHCFGNFEVFIDDKPVKFKRKKTKELLAYLVDRKGARATVREICAVVWEDYDNETNAQAYFRKCVADIRQTFEEYGVDDVLISEHGAYSLNNDGFWCDMYEYLKGNLDVAEGNYEYMNQYSWSEYSSPFADEY